MILISAYSLKDSTCLIGLSAAKVSILSAFHKFFPEKRIGITIFDGEKTLSPLQTSPRRGGL